MNKIYLMIILACAILVSCTHDTEKNEILSTPTNSENETSYQLDSVKIAHFFKHHLHINFDKEKVNQFYKKRNYQFVWLSADGLNEHVESLINLIAQEIINDSLKSKINIDKLKWLYILFSDSSYQYKRTESLSLELELLLTFHFFDYAKRNWGGASDDDLKTVNWFIQRKKINYEQLLDTILGSNDHSTAIVEPVYRQYNLLKAYLKKYDRIEKLGNWPLLDTKNNKLKLGDTSLLVPIIKRQLFLLEDLQVADSSLLFNNQLESAIKKLQRRMGLQSDGKLNEQTKKALSTSMHDRIQQLLINIERCKWLPIAMSGDYLVVNIPEFKLHVYHDDSLKWSCNVIVGDIEPMHNTVIFNDELEYIVFSPYWNIPPNIIINETLPEIKKDNSYLEKHHLEVVTNSGKAVSLSNIKWNHYTTHFPYIIRQQPGKDNSLGLVKFLLPNSYDIYLHDTPSKSLFDETSRTFSHGCIRIAEPFKLAKYLLRNDEKFTDEKINNLMLNNKETFVRLKTKVPVFIAYFTAWVDRNGELNFRDDIYHNDEKMKELLFGK